VRLSSEVKIAMARQVASRWISENAREEYRFTVMPGSSKTDMDLRLLVGTLRSWRDGRSRIGSLSVIQDLGVREMSGDNTIEIWASDCDGLRKLSNWMESRGFETTFIW